MNHFVSFRARDDFFAALRSTAVERGVPLSRLIREVLGREIQIRPETTRGPIEATPVSDERGVP